MNITSVRIRSTFTGQGRMKAVASIVVDGTIAIHDLKVIEGPDRLFVAMPSRKDETGEFRDIVHPISKEGRRLIEEAVIAQYQTDIESVRGKSQWQNPAAGFRE